ncbi:MAG TPA: acyltransferase family protein [Terriglobales bacterium]|nr:acyltransferase family protein [Terriglobales bacterium]
MKHRPDIDGLRAVAIVPVLLFHAGISRFSGGYVGVDVFFVISGYLITNLILDDISKDRFSVAHFYERRVRRILPALLTVMFGTALLGYRLLMPDDAQGLGQSVLATMFFCSNILFSKQSGYFQAPAESKPLLHTWSLAVEEQFYILYPPFLYLVSRFFRKRYAAALVTVLALSFVYSVKLVTHHRSTAFYSSPARAWELLLGGLLALHVISPLRNRIASNSAAFLGLGLLGYSFVHFSGSTLFPGASALCPTLGTALLIYSAEAERTVIANVLSIKPIVFLGLISYSLYLWHWVLLFFFKYYLGRSLTGWEIAGVLGISVLAASLSWKFVENPFRGRHGLIRSRKQLFAAATLASVAFASFGGLLYMRHGFPSRFDSRVLALLASKGDVWNTRNACREQICGVGERGVAPSFLLWGDSHAGAIAPAFEYAAEANHLSGLVAFSPGCAPLLDLKRYDEDDPNECTRIGQRVLHRIMEDHIPTVFLHARWALYAEGTRFRQEPGPPALLTRDQTPGEDYPVFSSLLRRTIVRLQGQHLTVILIASVPEFGIEAPTVLARNVLYGTETTTQVSLSDFLARQARTFQLFREVADQYGVQVVYPHTSLCDATSCNVIRGNDVLYVDSNHLSLHGAMYVESAIAPLLGNSGRTVVSLLNNDLRQSATDPSASVHLK